MEDDSPVGMEARHLPLSRAAVMAAFLAAAGSGAAADVAQGALTSTLVEGELQVRGEGADSIAITCDGGSVEVNGAAPFGTPLACDSITGIYAEGGDLGSVIDLSAVGAPDFSLATVTIDGRIGDDDVAGSDFGDLVVGGMGTPTDASGDDTLDGGDGPDSIFGDGGNDTLDGGVGADSLVGGPDTDSVDGGEGDDVMGSVTDQFSEMLPGGPPDTLLGGPGADRMEGGPGTDSLTGGIGTDTLSGEFDSDTVDGGDDVDVLIERVDRLRTSGFELAGLTLSTDMLFASDAAGVDGDQDNLTGVEQASLTGDAASNRIDASAFDGTVTLDGGAGSDEVTGGAQSDSLTGGSGADTVSDGSGSNSFFVRDSVADEVYCGIDDDTVTADLVDVLDPGCASDLVLFPPPAPPGEDTDTGASTTTPSGTTQTATPGVVADLVGPTMAIARTARFKSGNVVVRLTCPAAEPAPCAGRLRLETASAVTVAGARPPTAAQTRRKRRLKLGSRSFSVAPGKSATLRVRISKKNLRTLTKLGRVRIKLRAAARDQAGNAKTTTRTVAVRFPRPKRS